MTDHELLTILHRMDNLGHTAKQIAEDMGGGLTRSMVLGHKFRIGKQADLHNDDLVKKPENRDGGMPTLWWNQ